MPQSLGETELGNEKPCDSELCCANAVWAQNGQATCLKLHSTLVGKVKFTSSHCLTPKGSLKSRSGVCGEEEESLSLLYDRLW